MFKPPRLSALGLVALIVDNVNDNDNDKDKKVPTFWVRSGD